MSKGVKGDLGGGEGGGRQGREGRWVESAFETTLHARGMYKNMSGLAWI